MSPIGNVFSVVESWLGGRSVGRCVGGGGLGGLGESLFRTALTGERRRKCGDGLADFATTGVWQIPPKEAYVRKDSMTKCGTFLWLFCFLDLFLVSVLISVSLQITSQVTMHADKGLYEQQNYLFAFRGCAF